jgi:pilus assembly protein FimV
LGELEKINMSRRLHRLWLLPLLFLAGQAWALGLGDIRLDSALNQPLRAEIQLLAATPEELNNLTVQMAAAETFRRYDLERPLYLTRIRFEVIRSGRADGNFVRITSTEPITEPFITFLVEAVWSRGRLLREYTLLLDPPTFAPPPTTPSTQAVTAPSRATPADSGEIQRPAPQQPAPQPAPQQAVRAPVQSPAPQDTAVPSPAAAEPGTEPPAQQEETFERADFMNIPGDDVLVVRGDTLWGITARVRPDSRLTFNQTMLAILAANPEAFEGNINRLKAGATLRIPSADEIFTINRADAFAEVQRQNEQWGGLPSSSTTPAVADTIAEPNLTLVPPDDDLSLTDTSSEPLQEDFADDAVDDVFVDPTEQRIREIEALIEDQDALIEIPDNELAALRNELAELRGEEPPEPLPVEDELDDPAVEEADGILADTDADDTASEPTATSVPAVVSRPPARPGVVDTMLGYLSNFWVIIGAALVVAVLVLVWFMRRAGGGDEEPTGVWETLDRDDMDPDSLASTETLHTMGHDDETTILVEEQVRLDADDLGFDDDDDFGTIESPSTAAAEFATADEETDSLSDSAARQTLEDTFSSETAINLDQSDPVAEADFHMAYGLYDQAADLINGALAEDPERPDLLSKLCEIYFVWGNRDAFIDAAGRMREVTGGKMDADWDKIVIMGQQIAGDHEMFSGVSAGAATKAVDLSFEGGDDDTGALDMNLGDDADDDGGEVIDLGADTGQVSIATARGEEIDFSFDEPDPAEASATHEMSDRDPDTTGVESDLDDDVDFGEADHQGTVETPTIEKQFEVLEATGELPALGRPRETGPSPDATAEIDLDDLGLDLDSLAEASLAADLDDLADTSESRALKVDDLDATGSDYLPDDDEPTGQNTALGEPAADTGKTGIQKGIDRTAAIEADEATLLARDDTGINPAASGNNIDREIDFDSSLLDATGMTQVISEDLAVDTSTDAAATLSDDDKTMLAPRLPSDETGDELPDDVATMLAPFDDDADDDADDGDFDFAKTEALPKDSFSSDISSDDTGRMHGLTGSTDMDLDLDDLTAALKVSEVGDTVNQVRDDATVEQPRIKRSEDVDLDVGMMVDEDDSSTTQALAPDDLSGDLHDARTMTEVGTKLDLARAYVDMGDPGGARSILEEVLDEGDAAQRQQAQRLLDSLPA